MPKLIQVYTPVTHDDGERLVQITDENNNLLGWADGRGKFDITGEWTISNAWSGSQALEFGRVLQRLTGNGLSHTTIVSGVQRIVTITF